MTINTILDVSKLPKYKAFIRALHKPSLIPFCGAGISLECPTHLPVAWELKECIFKSYCQANPDLIEIYRSYGSADSSTWSLSQLPLEYMLEASFAESRIQFDTLLSFMQFVTPNQFHHTLSSLGEMGIFRKILTTNFDHCIERASENSLHNVEHLHGSVGDHDSLVVTIERMGKGLPLQHSDSIKRLHKKYNLLFLGYSGNDPDIMEILLATKGKPVFWLCVDRDMNSISDSAKRLISQSKGTIIIGNMKAFNHILCSMTNSDLIAISDCECKINWQSHIKNYVGKLPSSMRERFVARICLEANMLPQAIKAYSMAIRDERSNRQKAKNSVNLAFAYYIQRDYLQTRRIAKQALSFAMTSKDARSVAHAYNSLGLSYLDGTSQELLKAYSYFKKAARIHNSLANNGKHVNRNLRGNAQSLNNLGLVCMKINKRAEAIESFQTSIKLKKKTG